MIAIIGTSDQSCWLAEACKNPSLEDLWMYGVTVCRTAVTVVTVTNVRLSGGRLKAELSTVRNFQPSRDFQQVSYTSWTC